MAKRVNPAVVAGLVAAGAVASPQPAQAMPAVLQDVADVVYSSPQTALACGFVGGVMACAATVAIAGGIGALVEKRRERDVPQLTFGSHAQKPWFDEADAPAPATPAAAPAAKKPAARFSAPDSAKQPVAAQAPAAHKAHAATDYEDIATNYVSRNTFKQRMATRAAGVAETLRARIEAERMGDMPVITRADGSVGDVGTGWWTAAVGQDAISSNKGYAEDSGSLEIPSDFTNPGAEKFFVEARKKSAGVSISERIAYVDEGAFPERRSVADINDEADAWATSLRSLDEKIAAESGVAKVVTGPSETGAAAPVHAAFFDNIGDAATLDEPDNMETPTSFLMFKNPAGHPEVHDTESYVDYLIDDEFKHNSSKAARVSSKNFLRLVQGGTQSGKTGASRRHDASTGATPYVGKHFATPKAQEA